MLQEMVAVGSVISPVGFQTNLDSKHKLWRQCVSLFVKIDYPLADDIRWTIIICHDFIGTEGATYLRSKDSTVCCNRLGGCDFCHVQLSA
jgi:hypothetical protein